MHCSDSGHLELCIFQTDSILFLLAAKLPSTRKQPQALDGLNLMPACWPTLVEDVSLHITNSSVDSESDLLGYIAVREDKLQCHLFR
eukprot:CAMPEP_0178411230 /NCGR_PEP_ID=MMETSP0689_2-20121128/21387_1 /TAXON_ID=160604 /ORGANISM="Amphidinium massartii, Strain CS-259" /LENGTH=86 /DNA_ID=CAMNT_0020032429 /DNA_START=135 /DNA_END=391 /DNA_ORIENTATION=-